jgi:hypothetical protein
MRLSSLVVAITLLFASSVFAQHSTTSSTPPIPPPAPVAAPAPAPVATPAPPPAPVSSPTHTSAPSSPAPVSIPSSHATPAPAPTPNAPSSHVSISSSDSGVDKAASPPRSSTSGESRIVGSPRVGEATSTEAASTKEKPKAPESDLRRRICPDGSCKDPKPEPTDGDLRRRICTNGKCEECPPGQSPGKNGACSAAPAVAKTVSSCQPNESWNGSACAPMNRCQAGETWNGVECVNPTLCASFSSRAEMLAVEARGIRNEMERACSLNSQSQDCIRLTQNHDGAVQRYRMLLTEAPVSCRTTLPDPISL